MRKVLSWKEITDRKFYSNIAFTFGELNSTSCWPFAVTWYSCHTAARSIGMGNRNDETKADCSACDTDTWMSCGWYVIRSETQPPQRRQWKRHGSDSFALFEISFAIFASPIIQIGTPKVCIILLVLIFVLNKVYYGRCANGESLQVYFLLAFPVVTSLS